MRQGLVKFMSLLFNFVVNRASRNPALADTISCMFNDLDLRYANNPRNYWVVELADGVTEEQMREATEATIV